MEKDCWTIGNIVVLNWDSQKDWFLQKEPQSKLDGYRECKILYKLGDDVIMRIISSDIPSNFDVLGYYETRFFYPEFFDDDADEDTRYFCWNTSHNCPIFHVDPDLGYIEELCMFDNKIDYDMALNPIEADALRDQARRFFKFRKGIVKKFESIDNTKQIAIEISDEDVDQLNGTEYEEDSQKLYYSLPRAMHWMMSKDCAILTAWRGTQSYEVNSANNEKLQKQLRAGGYGVAKVKGMYAEVSKLPESERSFLVVDLVGDPEKFFSTVKKLSEDFDQDCFLYKKAGLSTPAILVGTNQDFIKGNGSMVEVGVLRINSKQTQAYTEVGSGRINFE